MIAVYCRVSTEEQAQKQTIENQIEFARKYADLHNLGELVFFTDEGISGVVPLDERPGGRELLRAVRNGQVNEVLLYRLDRLGRSARIILNAVHEIEKHARLRSMTEPFDTQDPTGRFLLTILAGVADLERETIRDRTQAGIRRAVEKGIFPGIPKLGWKKNTEGLLVPDETPVPGTDFCVCDIPRLIYRLIGERRYSTVQVAEYLNALGIPAASILMGRKNKAKQGWLPALIYNIVKDTAYKGVRKFKSKTNPVTCRVAPLVSEELWDRAQQVIAEHSRKNWYKPKHMYLLTGLVRCGTCGHIYSGRTVRRFYTTYCHLERMYLCNSKRHGWLKNCGSPNVNAYWLEDVVWKRITEFIRSPAPVLEEIMGNMPDAGELIKEKELVQETLAGKESERQKILDLFRRGYISVSDVEEQLSRMEKEKEQLNNRLAELQKSIDEMSDLSVRAVELNNLLKLLNQKTKELLSWDYKRQIVMCLVREILVYPGKNGDKHNIHFSFYFDDPARNLLTFSDMNKLRALIN